MPSSWPRWFGLEVRSLRLLTIAATSYLGRLASAAAVFVTIPMARAALPADLFGVWMMLSGLIAFFAFADLGVGNGVLNRMTSAHARGDRLEQRRVMRAGYACTLSVGALTLLVWMGWTMLARVPTIVVGDVDLSHQRDVLLALDVFVVLLAINIPASLGQKMQLGTQCGHWVGYTQFAAAIGTLVAVPAVLAVHGGLPALLLASLGVQVTANLTSAALWHRRFARADATRCARALGRLPQWPDVASLLRTGSLFLVLQLAGAFAFQSDAIVIVHQMSQAAYGDFAVVQRVFMAASSLLLAGLAGLWPAIGEALASSDSAWVRRTLLRSYLFVFALIGTCCLTLALLMTPILQAWVHARTPPATMLLVVLAIWTVMDAMANVSGAFLNAAGVLRAQIVFAALMALTAFAGKWVLVAELGAWGAVLATIVAYAVISVPAQVFLIRAQLHKIERSHGDQ